jgi:hypothetical protein
MRSRLFSVLALLLLIALPVSAADRVIQNGIDLWYTAGDGRTFINFAKDPLPAGFFCFKSAPFTERVIFRGIPVATGEKGGLGPTDTIVQRLDDAVFNKRGVAVTRVQVRALHFESVQPIQTACGAYKVEVRLNGVQPITRMRIVRNHESGGRFFAPIAVNGKVVFTPVGRASTEILEATRNVRFPANQGITWADRVGKQGVEKPGFVLVDTDNDRVPDTYLPGTSSNFAAGWKKPMGLQLKTAEMAEVASDCHLVEDTEGHCPGGVTYYYTN